MVDLYHYELRAGWDAFSLFAASAFIFAIIFSPFVAGAFILFNYNFIKTIDKEHPFWVKYGAFFVDLD